MPPRQQTQQKKKMLMMMSLSTHSSQGGLETRSHARWAAHSYTGYMLRIPKGSVCLRRSLNYARARCAGTGLSFGASSVHPLGGPMLIMPSPMRRRSGRVIPSGRRGSGVPLRCSRSRRAWKRSCVRSLRHCEGFPMSFCGTTRPCAGLGSTRRRVLTTVIAAIAVLLSKSVYLSFSFTFRR